MTKPKLVRKMNDNNKLAQVGVRLVKRRGRQLADMYDEGDPDRAAKGSRRWFDLAADEVVLAAVFALKDNVSLCVEDRVHGGILVVVVHHACDLFGTPLMIIRNLALFILSCVA